MLEVKEYPGDCNKFQHDSSFANNHLSRKKEMPGRTQSNGGGSGDVDTARENTVMLSHGETPVLRLEEGANPLEFYSWLCH